MKADEMRTVVYLPAPQLVERLNTGLFTAQILVILFVAAVLRLNNITQPLTDVFSWRQTSTAMMADNYFRKDANIFFPEVSWSGPGPSYQGREFQTVSYLAALIYRVVGQQDWVGRGIAVLFSLWGIFALYQLVRCVWDEPHAVASALMLALLPGAIFIDRSFLPDPAMLSLVITSLWMLAAYAQAERPRYLVLACFFAAWGFLSKLPGALVALPMLYMLIAIFGLKRLTEPRRLITLLGAAILTLAPVIAYYLWARHLARSYPPYHFAGSGNWIWVDGLGKWWDQGYFLSRSFTNFYYWLLTWPIMGLAAIGLLFGSLAARSIQPAQTSSSMPVEPRRAPWLFHWWLFGCIMFYLIGARELVENPWNFHLFNPPIAVLAGHALVLIWSFGHSKVWNWAAAGRLGVILLIVVVVGQGVLKTMYKPEHATQSYRMGLALHEMTQPGDLVVTLANDIGDPVAIYYSQRRGWVFPPADIDRAWNELPANDDESILLFDQLRTQGAGWFGIVNERKKDFWVDHPKLVEYIKRTSEFKIKTDDYVIYRIRNPEEVAKLPNQ
jgi:hypothetical protein